MVKMYVKSDVDALAAKLAADILKLPSVEVSTAPPPTTPPPGDGVTISDPSIELTSPTMGVRMSRKVGVPQDPTWKADAGFWYTGPMGSITEASQLIGTADTCVYTGAVGNGARYRERYTKNGKSVFRWSQQVGPFAAFTGTPVPPAVPVSANLQRLIESMTTPNDGGLYLAHPPLNSDMTADKHGPLVGGKRVFAYVQHGLRASDRQSHWPGKYLDTIGVSTLARIRRLTWYVICRAQQQAPNQAMNTMAWMGAMKTVLLRKDGTWIPGNSSPMTDGRIAANWHASFSSPGNERVESISQGEGLYQSRSIDGGVAVHGVTQGNRKDWALHGWPCEDSMTMAEWRDNILGIIQMMDVSMLLHNPAGPDDRDLSGLMCWFGADWYEGSRYIGEHMHSKLWKLSKNKQQVYLTDIPEGVLRANPPPGFK